TPHPLSLLRDSDPGVPTLLPRLPFVVAARRRGAPSAARRDETPRDRALGARGRGVRGRECVRRPVSLARLRARHGRGIARGGPDRKSTRLNSSYVSTSYAVFCLKKKNLRSVRRRKRVATNDFSRRADCGNQHGCAGTALLRRERRSCPPSFPTRRSSDLATGLLALAAAVFAGASAFEGQYPWLGYVRATAEASLVGGQIGRAHV